MAGRMKTKELVRTIFEVGRIVPLQIVLISNLFDTVLYLPTIDTGVEDLICRFHPYCAAAYVRASDKGVWLTLIAYFFQNGRRDNYFLRCYHHCSICWYRDRCTASLKEF